MYPFIHLLLCMYCVGIQAPCFSSTTTLYCKNRACSTALSMYSNICCHSRRTQKPDVQSSMSTRFCAPTSEHSEDRGILPEPGGGSKKVGVEDSGAVREI